MGYPQKALKLIGAEVPEAEFANLDLDQLLCQFFIGILLTNLGAQFYASRIINKSQGEINRRNILITRKCPRYYNHLSGHLIKAYDVEGALVVIKKGLAVLVPESFQFKNLKLDQLQCKTNQGDYASVLIEIDCVERELLHNERSLVARLWLIKAQALAECGQLKRAVRLFEKVLKEDLNPAIKSAVLFHYAKTLLALARYDEALRAARLSFRIIKDQRNPRLDARSFALMRTISAKKFSLAQELSLFCHVNYSPYRHIFGVPHLSGKKLYKWIADHHRKSTKYDLWIVDAKKIVAANYRDVAGSLGSEKKFIDLCSGTIRGWNRKKGLQTLSSTHVRALHALFGAGCTGIYKWTLLDFVYRQDFFYPKTAEERINKLVRDLRKAGFEIKRHENIFSLSIPRNFKIIIPVRTVGQNPLALIAHQREFFNAKEIESFFSISKSTANKWIHEAISENTIKVKSNKRKQILYTLA